MDENAKNQIRKNRGNNHDSFKKIIFDKGKINSYRGLKKQEMERNRGNPTLQSFASLINPVRLSFFRFLTFPLDFLYPDNRMRLIVDSKVIYPHRFIT